MRAWAVSLAQGLCCLCCPHRSSPGQMLPGPLPGLRAALLLLPTCHGCSHTLAAPRARITGTTDRIPSRGYSGTGAKYAAVAAPRLPCRWFGLNESLFERTGGILAIKRLTGAARSPRRLLPGLSNQNGFYRLTIHCFCQFHRGYVSICISDMSLLTLATLLANFVRAAEHGHNSSKNNAPSWRTSNPSPSPRFPPRSLPQP